MERYKPKKYKSPAKAIREFCIECMGGRENEGHLKYIENCGSPECAVFDFRFGNNPYHIQNLTGRFYINPLPVIGRSVVITMQTREEKQHRNLSARKGKMIAGTTQIV